MLQQMAVVVVTVTVTVTDTAIVTVRTIMLTVARANNIKKVFIYIIGSGESYCQ
jgi:hypothetical protein